MLNPPVEQGCVPAFANPLAVRAPSLPSVLALRCVLACPAAAPGSPAGAGPPVASRSPAIPAAAILPARPASVVADGVTDDATASNNQVKVIRDLSAALVVTYAASVEAVPQGVLAPSRGGASGRTPVGQACCRAVPL